MAVKKVFFRGGGAGSCWNTPPFSNWAPMALVAWDNFGVVMEKQSSTVTNFKWIVGRGHHGYTFKKESHFCM